MTNRYKIYALKDIPVGCERGRWTLFEADVVRPRRGQAFIQREEYLSYDGYAAVLDDEMSKFKPAIMPDDQVAGIPISSQESYQQKNYRVYAMSDIPAGCIRGARRGNPFAAVSTFMRVGDNCIQWKDHQSLSGYAVVMDDEMSKFSKVNMITPQLAEVENKMRCTDDRCVVKLSEDERRVWAQQLQTKQKLAREKEMADKPKTMDHECDLIDLMCADK